MSKPRSPDSPPAPGIPATWIRPRRIDRVAAGARSGALADYKLLCEAGPYELDVLVREVEEPHGFELQGQITDAGRIHEPVASLDLELVRPPEAASLEACRTDDFGEFGFARRGKGPCGLRLGAGADAPFVLVWDGEA